MFLFSDGWWSFGCMICWGSNWSQLCHLQLPGLRASRGKGIIMIEDRAGGFYKPVLDVGHSAHILWLELKYKALSTWKGHWETEWSRVPRIKSFSQQCKTFKVMEAFTWGKWHLDSDLDEENQESNFRGGIASLRLYTLSLRQL